MIKLTHAISQMPSLLYARPTVQNVVIELAYVFIKLDPIIKIGSILLYLETHISGR
jgi:hypothetical protein